MDNRDKLFYRTQQTFTRLANDLKEIEVKDGTLEDYENTLKCLSQGLAVLEECIIKHTPFFALTFEGCTPQEYYGEYLHTLRLYEKNIIELENKMNALTVKAEKMLKEEKRLTSISNVTRGLISSSSFFSSSSFSFSSFSATSSSSSSSFSSSRSSLSSFSSSGLDSFFDSTPSPSSTSSEENANSSDDNSEKIRLLR